MNTERTIVLKNVSSNGVGLKDTQGRNYIIQANSKMRISSVSLQDILDYPGSRTIFNMGLVKVDNVDIDSLYKMGLTEDEINLYTEGQEEIKGEAKEEVKEEIKEEVKIVKEDSIKEEPEEAKTEPKKTTTTKKTTTKKSTAKKTTSSTKKA